MNRFYLDYISRGGGGRGDAGSSLDLGGVLFPLLIEILFRGSLRGNEDHQEWLRKKEGGGGGGVRS